MRIRIAVLSFGPKARILWAFGLFLSKNAAENIDARCRVDPVRVCTTVGDRLFLGVSFHSFDIVCF